MRMEMASLLQDTLEERATQVAEEAKKKKAKESEEKAKEAMEGEGEGQPGSAEEAQRQAAAQQQRMARVEAVPLVGSLEDTLGRVPAWVDLNQPLALGPQINKDVRSFMLRMKEGGRAESTDELISIMKGFKDNVTLDHLYRDQLVAMAQFLGMNHFTPTAILRFQLRQRLKRLRNEDKEIMWEGVKTLSESELKADLRSRGLPTHNLTREQMVRHFAAGPTRTPPRPPRCLSRPPLPHASLPTLPPRVPPPLSTPSARAPRPRTCACAGGQPARLALALPKEGPALLPPHPHQHAPLCREPGGAGGGRPPRRVGERHPHRLCRRPSRHVLAPIDPCQRVHPRGQGRVHQPG